MASDNLDRVVLLEGVDPQPFAAVEALAFPVPWRASSFLKGPSYRGWSLKLGERTLAFLYVQKVLDEAEIIRIAVVPEWRRRGLANRLWEVLVRHPGGCDPARVFLEVAAANAPARAFYERLGFRVSGRRAGYYGPGEDALNMIWEAPAVSR